MADEVRYPEWWVRAATNPSTAVIPGPSVLRSVNSPRVSELHTTPEATESLIKRRATGRCNLQSDIELGKNMMLFDLLASAFTERPSPPASSRVARGGQRGTPFGWPELRQG